MSNCFVSVRSKMSNEELMKINKNIFVFLIKNVLRATGYSSNDSMAIKATNKQRQGDKTKPSTAHWT